MRYLIYLFYFLSGFTALVYEVIWARKLGLIFGVDAYGIATVLIVFFTGLGVGSFIFGNIKYQISNIKNTDQKSKISGVIASERPASPKLQRGESERGNPLNMRLLRRFTPRNDNSALFVYGLLELGIGFYAVLTPLMFKGIEQIQVYVWQQFSLSYGGFSMVTFVLSLFALIVPTVLMGGTFPVVAKATAQMSADPSTPSASSGQASSGQVQRIGADNSVGWLYGLNTLGAVVGTLLAGFLLIWTLGMNLTTYFAAVVNLGIGVVAIIIGRSFLLSLRGVNEMSDKAKYRTVPGKAILSSTGLPRPSLALRARNDSVLLIIFFLTGFAALALEVLWTRVLILSFGASTYAFAAVLAIFLLGIAAGSIVISRILTNIKRMETNGAGWFCALLTVLGVLVVISTPLLGVLPQMLLDSLDPKQSSYWQIIGLTFILGSMVVLLPTILMGAVFVLGIKIYSISRMESRVGLLYGLNTLGGVAGAFVGGFVLLPIIGIQKGIVVAGLGYFLASLSVAFFLMRSRKMQLFVSAISFITIFVGLLLPSWNKHLLSSGVPVYFRDYLEDKNQFVNNISKAKILYYKEGLLATVMVKQSPEGFLFLRSNGKTDASTEQDLDNFKLVGHLPMILHPNPRNVLMVGIGSGISLGAMAAHETESIEPVEIEDAMIEAAKYFAEYNHNVLSDPRLKIIKADARGYLKSRINADGRLIIADKRYDVIASHPSNPWVKGNANLFTREFFEIARNSLKDDGLMLQWVQFYSFSNEDFKSILATFASVFPHVTVWTPVVSHDILLVGSKNPQLFDFEEVKKKLESEAVQQNLKTAAITNSERLLSHYLFDEKGIRTLISADLKADKARILTDDKPFLEFSAPFNLNKDTLVENLSQIISVKADVAEHFKNLGQADYAEIKKTKKAVDLILRAEIKAASNKLEEAIDDFEAAIKILPKLGTKKELARIYFELARRSNDANNAAKTLDYFEKSVSAHPNAQVYLNLSILYAQQNRLKKAKDALDKAKKLEPDNPRIPEIEKSINSM